jgi:hypothetical protein
MEGVIHVTYFHFLTTDISFSLPLIWNISIVFIKKLSVQFLSNDSLEDWSSNFEGHNAELVVCHLYIQFHARRQRGILHFYCNPPLPCDSKAEVLELCVITPN